MDDTECSEVSRATLAQAVGLVAVMTDEVVVRPGPDGWVMTAMSPDRVAMAVVTVPASGITGFDPGAEPFAVSVDDMTRSLRTRADTVRLRITDVLELTAGHITQRMPLLAVPDLPLKGTPHVEGSSAMVPVEPVTGLLGTAHPRCGEVSVSVDADGVSMYCWDEAGGASTDLHIPPEGCVWVDADACRTSRFPMDRIAPVLKAVPSDTQVVLTVDDDRPLLLEADVRGCGLRLLVAPRVWSA